MSVHLQIMQKQFSIRVQTLFPLDDGRTIGKLNIHFK
jgi:hypothetical protein